jgi:S1-C subfamily serine protease
MDDEQAVAALVALLAVAAALLAHQRAEQEGIHVGLGGGGEQLVGGNLLCGHAAEVRQRFTEARRIDRIRFGGLGGPAIGRGQLVGGGRFHGRLAPLPWPARPRRGREEQHDRAEGGESEQSVSVYLRIPLPPSTCADRDSTRWRPAGVVPTSDREDPMDVRTSDLLRRIPTIPLSTVALVVAVGACQQRKSPPAPSSSNTAQASTSPSSTGAQASEVTPRLSVPEAAQVITEAFAAAAKAIRPSVVRIDVEVGGTRSPALTRDDSPGRDLPDFLKRFFAPDLGEGRPDAPMPAPARGTGSGVIIDAEGHVITNAHVIARAQKVTITLVDGRKFDAKVLGADRLTDVGVVQLTAKPGTLTVARLGKSDDLKVGQWVLAVGSPLGLDQSVTAGIVSGIGGSGSRMRVSERGRGYIQTDAAINPGNSGGPLVNLAAEVVGINTMINVGPGGAYGFAIPVAQVAQVSQTLIKEGRVRYPYIGVNVGSVAELSDDMKRQLGGPLPAEGAVVIGVVPGGPAEQAAITPGDVITRIGDRKVATAADVVDAVSSQPIGSKMRVEVQRGGKARSVELTSRELPGEETAGGRGPVGVALQTLTDELARNLGLPAGLRGAVVAEVQPDSPAAKAGLGPGDVIVEVDRSPVGSAEAAATALRAGGRKAHLLRVLGPNGARFVTINVP